jgi:exodeoxyribonuclease VII small subunit
MKKELSFEDSIKRLEEILEKMNAGSVSLDESLKLFEEGDTLIAGCEKRLQTAEKKVEKLLKSRQGELLTDEEGNPLTEPLE